MAINNRNIHGFMANPKLVSGEKYYGWSPYVYCRNEPVSRIEMNNSCFNLVCTSNIFALFL